jgi:signal transduction histidine kinase
VEPGAATATIARLGVGGDLRTLTNLARAASAGPADPSSLLARVCASLAESFGLGRVEYRPELSGEADGLLLIPLVVSGRCLGFLTSESREALPREDGELLAAVGALVATLLQRALEADELERLSRLQSQFIALASHELRAPAAVIHGVAKTVAARAESLRADQLASLHETLAEHTDRMARLLDELLDLSRLDANAIEIRPSPTPVGERIREVVRAVAGERADEVVVDAPAELRPLLDIGAFDRILANLVTNALRYGRAPISVAAAQSDRHFRLTVEDHGDGVAPAFVPHLFERFARAERADGEKGSGLGLSIAQAFAQAHGGQVFYEDASPRGARFQLVLPAV